MSLWLNGSKQKGRECLFCQEEDVRLLVSIHDAQQQLQMEKTEPFIHPCSPFLVILCWFALHKLVLVLFCFLCLCGLWPKEHFCSILPLIVNVSVVLCRFLCMA